MNDNEPRAHEIAMLYMQLRGIADEKYENFIKDYPANLLIVDGDTIKFGNKPEDFEKVTDMIDAKLYGLFK